MRTRVYLASVEVLENEALFSHLLTALPEVRRSKTLALKNGAARRLSLGAGLLLAAALRDEGLTMGTLAVTELGKPFFPALPDFHFNLSHSGARVLCAVSPQSVGCDLEAPCAYDARLVRRFFHPEESARLLKLPEEEQPTAFLRLWTCKESFMKAVGLGFALPMADFAVTPGNPPTLTQQVDGRPWRLRSFLDGDYFCALCGLTGVEDAPLIRVDLSEVEL